MLTFFSKVLIYLLIAFIVSLLGRPLVKLFNEKMKMPNILACVLTMLIFIALLAGILWGVLPFLLKQIDSLKNVDFTELSGDIMLSLQPLQEKLWDLGIMQRDNSIYDAVVTYLSNFVSAISFEHLFSNIIGVVTSVFIGIFAVFFISFFFLRDQNLFHNIFMLFIPRSFEEKTNRILKNSQKMLFRYFGGLLLDIFIYTIVLSSTLAILGIKNVLLIGVLAGVCNFIPYLGPVLGCSIACVLTYISAISGGNAHEITPMFIKIISTFVACNMLDAFFLQPNIYSKFVKAHPLEIFLVILLTSQIFGITGMIFAIPLYTLFRIIAKEFFNQSKLVNKLTEQI
jgi:predicted PurR-regulated permease PerM